MRKKNAEYKVIVNAENVPEYNLEENEFVFGTVNEALNFLVQNKMVTSIWTKIIQTRDTSVSKGLLDKSNWYELNKIA
ncbi:MAG: hypothetical protein K6A23_08485 [Butyrivibrio sp.]|nr:hypothetical protein [Butyrivibrio sp.]